GGIGKAIAKKMAREGAVVGLNDINAERLAECEQECVTYFGRDAVISTLLDVTDEAQIREALKTASLAFGGIDIVVNNAGLSISKSIEDHTQKDWNLLYDVLVKGQFLVTQAVTPILKGQHIGGDILNTVSKNALVSGPNNIGYG